MEEQELVVRYKELTDMIELLEAQVKQTRKDREDTVHSLLELMQAEGKDRTASYEGVGYITPIKPEVYASYPEEQKDALFSFLKDVERGDLIKETVHPKSLSSFVKEMLEAGTEPPECISYIFKPRVRLYK